MANKLKNMRLTSVDLVRNGANQEADICLFKSADTAEDPTQPTASEKNIFKRFINWLRENPADEPQDDVDPIEKADDQPDLVDVYKSAITESLQSIIADESLTAAEKNDMIAKSLDEYHEAMLDLFDLAKADDEDMSYIFEDLEKSDPGEEADDEWEENEDDDPEGEEEVEKYNHNHGSDGRFVSGGGGGGGLSGSDVRSFGVPGTSSSYHMSKKEKKLAQTIIDNEELDLEIQDGHDAYGNPSTSFRGTREDYQTFKEMWNMVAPSELGKSADVVDIEVVEKFNPNHDSQGRFATAGGAGGGGDFLLDGDDDEVPWASAGGASPQSTAETKKPQGEPAKVNPENPLPNVQIDTSSYSWFKHGKEPGGVGYYSYEVTHGKNKLTTYNFHGDYHDGLRKVAEKFKDVSHISVGV